MILRVRLMTIICLAFMSMAPTAATAATDSDDGWTLTKTAPGTATLGNPYTFTMVSEIGGQASFTTISDVLPPEVDFVSADIVQSPADNPTCNYDSFNHIVNCEADSIGLGTTVTIHVTVIPRQIGTFVNHADQDDSDENISLEVDEPFTVVAPAAAGVAGTLACRPAAAITRITKTGLRYSVDGLTLPLLAGQPGIFTSGGRVLGSSIVNASGAFTATIDSGNANRIRASVSLGSSLDFSLTRRLRVVRTRVSGRKLLVTVKVSNTRGRRTLMSLRHADLCTAETPAGTRRLDRHGRATFSLPVPPAGTKALYRATSPFVVGQTFTLPLVVAAP